MNDHVAKPIDPDELFNALLKWIKPKAQVGAALPQDKHAKQSADAPIDLDSIAGLDTKLGLKRVMGKMPLYINMLKKYVETGPAALLDLKQAIAVKDQDTAERIAHTFKGISGNIGASALQDMAGNIEKLIKTPKNKDALLKDLEQFSLAQNAMVDAIALALSLDCTKADSTAPEVQKQAMDEKILQSFIALLKDDDTGALPYLEKHEQAFKAHFSNQIFNTINEALLEFDFEKALVLVIT
jgi:two-component system sensor histidine kinase/response regulator